MPPPRLLPDLPKAPPAPRPAAADDMLYGVEAIREALRLPKQKQVYKLHEARTRSKDPAPIMKLEGVGFAARRSSLEAWLERREREAVAGLDAGR